MNKNIEPFNDKSQWFRPRNPLSVDTETGEFIITQQDSPASETFATVPNNFFIPAPVKTFGYLIGEIEAMAGDYDRYRDQSKPIILSSEAQTESRLDEENRFIREGEWIKRN